MQSDTENITDALFILTGWTLVQYVLNRVAHYMVCASFDIKDVTTPYSDEEPEPANFICDNMARFFMYIEDNTRQAININ